MTAKLYKGTSVFLLGLAAILLHSQAGPGGPPDYEKKLAAIRSLEAGVVPLFVIGDLNEDGAVDNRDVALLQQYLDRQPSTPSAIGISCLAAADLNMNGRVEARDLAVLRDILKRGAIQAPALSSRSRLGCEYRNFILAARPAASPGGVVPVHFLDPRFTPKNSSAQVSAGPAGVSNTADGFLVTVEKTAKPGSLVTVNLALAGGGKYMYSFVVEPEPGQSLKM